MTELSAETPEQIAAWLSSVAHDPVAFVRDAFPWGQGELANSSGPEPWQLWVLEQIRDGLLKPGEAIKIAIASGHGVGKSALCSWIALWAISTFPDTRGIITASSESMLMTRLRAELRLWMRRFRGQSFFELTATSLISIDSAHTFTWRIDLLPWSETRSEAFAGLHNKNRRIILIMDEASAIADIIWETAEAVASDHDAEVIWISCGNPLRSSGRFKDCFERFQHRWITRHVNSLDVSFTNKLEMNRWIEDFGADSDFVRTRVLGEFGRVGSTQFIGPELVDEAMKRELVVSRSDRLIAGIDVARFGDDASTILARKGADCRSIPPLIFRGLPLDQFEDRIVAFCNAHRISELFIDGTGLGGGLVDHLRRRGYTVHDVQFGAKADQMIDGVRYANKRAEIWGQMRNALRYLCLPNNQQLKEELCGPEYTFSRTGDAIQLEPKEMMKRRGLPSPDLADALAVTFAAEIALLPELSLAGRGDHLVVHEYDPFSAEALSGRPYPEATRKYYAPPDPGGWGKWPRLKREYENTSE